MRKPVALLLGWQLVCLPSPAGAVTDGSTLLASRQATGKTQPSAGAPLGTSDPFTGAASFAVPIALPPGTGGMQPELQLRYSSGSRAESWVGYGWTLGFGSVQRTLKDGVPCYEPPVVCTTPPICPPDPPCEETVDFVLAGEDLVPDAIEAGRYHTRRESFQRIERVSWDAGLEAWVLDPDGLVWQVVEKDGTASRYGVSANSRIEKEPGRPFAWLLAEREDVHGNAFVVSYDERDPGTRYPSEVLYTLRRNGALLESMGPAAERSVRFVLEPRPDVSVKYAAGLEQQLAHRLQQIEVSVGGQSFRVYELQYGTPSADSFRSLLREVHEYGSDADPADLGATGTTPPHVTTFGYSSNVAGGTLGWQAASGWDLPQGLFFVDDQHRDAGNRLGDMDGDGLPDLVRAAQLDPGLSNDALSGTYLNLGAGFDTTADPSWDLPTYNAMRRNEPRVPPFNFCSPPLAETRQHSFVRGSASEPEATGTVLVDMNSDGLADLLMLKLELWGGLNVLPTLELHHNTGAGWTPIRTIPPQLFNQARSYPDGDPFWNNTGEHGLSITFFQSDSNDCFIDPITVDGRSDLTELNGDGLPDIVTKAVHQFLDLEPSGPVLVPVFRAGAETTFTLNTPNGPNLLLFESDRFLAPTPPGGSGLEQAPVQLSFAFVQNEGPQPTALLRFGRRQLDVNGDGLDDQIVASYADVPGSGIFDTSAAFIHDGWDYLHDADWLVPAGLHFDRFDSDLISRDEGVRFADVNGDGRVDLVQAHPIRGLNIWLNTGDPADPWLAQGLDPALDWIWPSGLHFTDDEGRDEGVRLVDLDGDGMVDMLRSREVGGAAETTAFLNRGSVPDLLETAQNFLGGTTTFEYAPASSYNDPLDAFAEFPFSTPVVASISVDDGRGTVGQTSFDYRGGLYDAADREMRGFRQVRVTDPAGTTTETLYHQDLAKAGLVERQTVTDPTAAVWREVEFAYVVDVEPPYLQLPETITVREVDGQDPAEARTIVTEQQYDAYGNPTITISSGDPGPAGGPAAPDRVLERRYTQPNLARYVVDRVAVIRQLDPDDWSTVLERTQHFYDGAESQPVQQVPDKGLLTKRVLRVDETGVPDPTERFAYDEFGNLRFETNARGFVTETVYDTVFQAFPAAVIDRLPAHTTSFAYAPGACPIANPPGAGLVHLETDPNANTTSRCYDAFGRVEEEVVTETGPPALELARTETVYVDLPGNASVTVDRHADASRVRSTTTFLDGLGRPYGSLADGPQGLTVETLTVYDGRGRVEQESRPFFSGDPVHSTSFEYDPLGRVKKVTDPAGREVTTSVDRGTTTVVDPNGNRRDVVRDVFGDLRQVHEFPNGPGGASTVTGYEYDHQGRLRFVRPAAPDAGEPTVPDTEVVYDKIGRRTAIIDPDTGTTGFSYDENGNVLTQTDARGITTTNSYDALDRLATSATDGPGSLSVSLTYDETAVSPNAIGSLTTATDPTGAHRFAHDGLGRVTREEHDLEGRRFVLSESFDGLGQTLRRIHPDEGSPASEVEYTYDADGFLTAVDDLVAQLSLAAGIEFDAQGRLVAFQTGDGVDTREIYDPLTNLIDRIEVKRGGEILESLDYGFDPGGRLETIDDLRDGSLGRSFGYDPLDRVTSADGPYGPGLAQALLSFDHDKYGNLTEKDGVVHGYGESGAPPHAVSSIGAQTLTYDAAGNLQTFGTRSYTWDERNRLGSASDTGASASYAYDYAGRRVRTVEPGETRLFVTPDFEWDGSEATAHVFAAGRRMASLSFAYDPPLAAADTGAPERSPLALVLAASAAPPLLLLVLIAWAPSRGPPRRHRLRRGLATATLVLFWCSIPAPLVAQMGDQDGDGIPDAQDNCLAEPNPSQLDTNLEGYGNDCDADYTNDGLVLGPDFVALSVAFGSTPPGPPYDPDVDRDGNGAVGAPEFNLLSLQFGGPPGPSGLACAGNVPCPAPPEEPVVFYHGDHLGSTTLLTGLAGNVVARAVYRPFGEALLPPDPPGNQVPEFGFTGQRFEPDLALYDYGARFYDPALGRFLQPDPIVPEPGDPQSLNRYSYARNNPLTRIDPTGNEDGFFTSFLFGTADQLAGYEDSLRALPRTTPLLDFPLGLAIGGLGFFRFAHAATNPFGDLFSSRSFLRESAVGLVEFSRALDDDPFGTAGRLGGRLLTDPRFAGELAFGFGLAASFARAGSVASPATRAGPRVFRQGTFADESVDWGGNYVKGRQWAGENPLTTPDFPKRYGLPAENARPDWVVGGRIRGDYQVRPAPPSHNNPLNTGGAPEYIPRNPDDVILEFFHMPD